MQFPYEKNLMIHLGGLFEGQPPIPHCSLRTFCMPGLTVTLRVRTYENHEKAYCTSVSALHSFEKRQIDRKKLKGWKEEQQAKVSTKVWTPGHLQAGIKHQEIH